MKHNNIVKNYYKLKKYLSGENLDFIKIGKIISKRFTKKYRNKAIKEQIDRIFQNNEKTITIGIESLLKNGFLRSSIEIEKDIHNIPEEIAKKIIYNADKIVKNQFILYGHYNVSYGKNSFSWLKDPVSGFKWHENTRSFFAGQNAPTGTDIKNTWEISRFQFLSTLSYAYLLTKNESYPCFVIEKLLSWMKQNPYLQGPNWLIAMESSIRLINWCFYLPLIDILSFSDRGLIDVIARCFLEHIVFIRENLELSIFKENNHYLSNIVGLIPANLLFPTVKYANDCSEFAINEFEKEIKKQFYESGINFEGSLSYHRLSSEMSIVGVELIKKIRGKLNEHLEKRIKEIYKFTEIYTSFSEEIPVIGDNDSGIFLDFFPRQSLNNHNYLNILFKIALNEDIKAKNCNDLLCAVALKKIGLHKDFNKKVNTCLSLSKKLYVENFNGLIIGCKDGYGLFFNTFHSSHGHTHNDKLSFYPVIGNKHLFVDRGTFSYTGFINKRYKDRKTNSHNAPVINDWEQNKLWKDDVFFMNEDAKTNFIHSVDNGILKIIGWHDGYKRYRSKMRVFRQIDWDYAKKIIAITDWAESNSKEKNQFTWNFLINPFWKSIVANQEIHFKDNSNKVIFIIDDNIKFHSKKSKYCPNYMQELPCTSIECTGTAISNEKYKFLIYY